MQYIFDAFGCSVFLIKSSVFSIHNINGMKLLSSLRLNFSHLNEHKFQHNFKDWPNWKFHYLLRCYLSSTLMLELFNGTCTYGPSLRSYSNNNLLAILSQRSEEFSVSVNKEILKCTIKFLKASKSFDVSLYWPLSF